MVTKINKARVSVGILLLVGMLGVTLLYVVANLRSGVGVLTTAVSAQPGSDVTPHLQSTNRPNIHEDRGR